MLTTSGPAEVSASSHHRSAGSTLLFVLVTAAACAIAAYTAAAAVLGASRPIVLLPFVMLLGVLLAVIALVRIEAFLLTVLALRTALDALKLDAAILDPASVVGLLLLGVVPLWLLLQHRSGAMPFRLTRTGVAVGAFTAAAALGIVVSPDPLSSALEWSRIATATAMFFAIEQIVLHREGFKHKALTAIFLALPLPVLAVVAQLASGEGLFEAAGFSRVTGTFAHSNPFAAYLTLVVIMATACAVELRGRARIWSVVVIAVAGPVLLLTYTRGAWIAAALGLAVVALVLRRALVAVLLAAALAATLLLVPSVSDRLTTVSEVTQEDSPGQDSLSWRLNYWRNAVSLAEDSPIVGIGLKQIAQSLPEAKQPHNDFVRAYVELGVLGFTTFLAMLGWFVLFGFRSAGRLRAERGQPGRSLDVAIAGGFAGVAVAFATMSIVANLMSQTVVLVYVMALAALASAVAIRAQDRRRAEVRAKAAATRDESASR